MKQYPPFVTVFLVIVLGLLVACSPQLSDSVSETDLDTAVSEVETEPSVPAPTKAPETILDTPVPEIAAEATATVAEPSQPAPTKALCPEVPRPALGLFIPGERYLITDSLSGKSCYTTLDGDVPGLFQAANDALYYTILQDDQFVVKRLAQDGAASLLSFTAVDQEDALLYHSFVVSEDGSRIAWGADSAGADYAGPELSNLWLAGINNQDEVPPLLEWQSEGENRRALVPVRFSADNSTLFYTLQPIGIGGLWRSFVGRYDNLYALPLGTDAEPALIFECNNDHTVLCIGDFEERDGQVTTLAYVDGGAVVISNGAGDILNTIELEDDYVGYPTFGPGGELVFYGAELSTDPNASILPEKGTIYRVAPPTAPQEVLASSPELLFPSAWLDNTHVVVGYTSGGDNWGTAVVGLDGSLQVVQSEPNASFVDILPQIAQPEDEQPASAAACPEATADTWQLIHSQHGYCLLYPLEYKVEKTNEFATGLVIDSILNHIDPSVSITVEPADDRTAQTAAQALLAEYPADWITDLGTKQEAITVAGETAELIDKLPGQDINRRVFFVHDDLLYQLFFSPVHTGDAQLDERVETLFEQITGSFTFIPRSDEVAEACLEPKPEMLLLRQEEHGYCLLYPAGYQVEQPTETETVLYVGSPMDVEHPKLFIEVQDAAGKTAVEAADEVAASFPADFGVERSFGVRLGFETAEQLDNVPGQDIGRVVFVTYNGRLYKLTFVPASPDAGEVYSEMETLYRLVNNTFRFLP